MEIPADLDVEHRSPPLLALAIVITALFVGGLVLMAVLTRGEHIPSPFDPTSTSTSFFSDFGSAVRLNAFLQLGAAIVFGNFVASVVSRLRFFGLRMAGLNIALFGGIAAASFALLASLLMWVLTQIDPIGNRELIHALHLTLFAIGGIGFVAASGPFMAGVSLAGGLSGLLPRWLMWLGLGLALVSELATLTLVTPAAVYLLPLSRFGSFVWLIGVGATLPRSHDEAHADATSPHRASPSAA
jgi:hypothetical protein